NRVDFEFSFQIWLFFFFFSFFFLFFFTCDLILFFHLQKSSQFFVIYFIIFVKLLELKLSPDSNVQIYSEILELKIKEKSDIRVKVIKMALVSGGRSTLNPNAPLYIPAAFRHVEDFSPEWWQLVTTLTWYHDYWVSQQNDDEDFYDDDEFVGNDVVDLLPDAFDLDVDDDLSIEAQLEEFIRSSEAQEQTFVEAKKFTG
ncbi:unnamed protein product, partial [Trifolium pratense]